MSPELVIKYMKDFRWQSLCEKDYKQKRLTEIYQFTESLILVVSFSGFVL